MVEKLSQVGTPVSVTMAILFVVRYGLPHLRKMADAYFNWKTNKDHASIFAQDKTIEQVWDEEGHIRMSRKPPESTIPNPEGESE